MSEVWPEVLRKAADRRLLRPLVTIIGSDPDTVTYEVIARLVAEPTGEPLPLSAEGRQSTQDAGHRSSACVAGPRPVQSDDRLTQSGLRGQGKHPPNCLPVSADDLRGLDDDQVDVLRSCAAVLVDLVATAETAEHTSVRSPEFADVFAQLQVRLGHAKAKLLAAKRVVGLTTWPDTAWAAKFIAARDSAQRDVEAAEGRSDMPGRTGHALQSAAALLELLTDRYPTLFKMWE